MGTGRRRPHCHRAPIKRFLPATAHQLAPVTVPKNLTLDHLSNGSIAIAAGVDSASQLPAGACRFHCPEPPLTTAPCAFRSLAPRAPPCMSQMGVRMDLCKAGASGIASQGWLEVVESGTATRVLVPLPGSVSLERRGASSTQACQAALSAAAGDKAACVFAVGEAHPTIGTQICL